MHGCWQRHGNGESGDLTMEKRLGKIEILGKEYPLNFSVRLGQEFHEALAAKPEGVFGVEKQNLHLLALMLKDGAAFTRVVTGEAMDPPTEEQLELIFTPGDNAKIVEAVRDTIEKGGVRLVQAKPKKNEAAEQPPRNPKA